MENMIELNGEQVALAGEHRIALADFVRDAGATSVHLGCEHGVCGSCNVLVDGHAVRSCLTLARSCEGRTVVSLEGLQDDLAQALRAAFNRHHALQCGFCTPGVFVAAYELLASRRVLDEAAVRERMAGNICRCTGYQGIVEAILDVAQGRKENT
jgi:carbon-monoxide dehydrogenase small subunit